MSDRALPATDNDAAAVTPAAPGIRFHPSDEELISYYLKKKVEGKPMRFDVIAEVDVYKIEPSDLPAHSRLKTKDQQWFFFSALQKKYGKRNRMNRATDKGFWKKTGEDKEIKGGDKKLIGTMKTLVFYNGRPQKSKRTNWVANEYCLAANDQGLEIDAYALWRVFLKKQAGPNRGFVYAPFSEQEWDDDDDDGGIAPGSVVHANTVNEIQQENYSQNKKECLPLCGINKEAPLRLINYKRKAQIDSNESTKDHCSSPAKTGDAISSVAEEKEPEPVATMVPSSSSTERINDLQKEMQQMSLERETYEREMTEAEVIISRLQWQIDTLRAENEELKKKKNSNNGLCS